VQRSSIGDIVENKIRSGDLELTHNGLNRAVLELYRLQAQLKDSDTKRKNKDESVEDPVQKRIKLTHVPASTSAAANARPFTPPPSALSLQPVASPIKQPQQPFPAQYESLPDYLNWDNDCIVTGQKYRDSP
jgi:hypothetical protein